MGKWESPGLVVQWIFGAIFLVSSLVLFIILLVRENFRKIKYAKLEEEKLRLEYNQSLIDNNIVAQERERERIAADIHDTLIGTLATIQLTNMEPDSRSEVNRLLKDSITIARKISHDLSLPMVEYTDLDGLIENIIIPWRRKYKVDYRKDLRVASPVGYAMKIQLTRILQELLTNTGKHSGAGLISVHLRHTHRWLLLSVQDDGRGFNTTGISKGLGLKNIEFRIKHIGGYYKLKSTPGKGTSYLFCISQNN